MAQSFAEKGKKVIKISSYGQNAINEYMRANAEIDCGKIHSVIGFAAAV